MRSVFYPAKSQTMESSNFVIVAMKKSTLLSESSRVQQQYKNQNQGKKTSVFQKRFNLSEKTSDSWGIRDNSLNKIITDKFFCI